MKYDPIKHIIGNVVRDNVFLRRGFYALLGLMFLREWHVKRAIRLLMKDAAPQTMLDAGSGFGQYSYYCAKNFPRLSILAVDVKEEQIEDCRRFFAARGLGSVRFGAEDLTQPLHDQEFDLILSVDVMEHIRDDVAVFRNFFRALRPGGIVLINTPSAYGGSDAHSGEDASFIEEHARTGYDVGEIKTKLSSAGLATETVRFTYGYFGSLAWRLGIKYPMLLLNASKAFFLLLPFYYVLTLPITLLFMYLDYIGTNETGTGLLVTARKQ